MTRTNAREIAIHLIYSIQYTKESVDQSISGLFAQDYYSTLSTENQVYGDRPDATQRAYIKTVVDGVMEQMESLNQSVQKYSIGWSLHRISKLALTIMQVAMFEILHVEDVPTSAAVSEAVELTRKYEDEDIVSFVNGILGSFCREIAQ